MSRNQGWPGEKQRHTMSCRGINTTVNTRFKRQILFSTRFGNKINVILSDIPVVQQIIERVVGQHVNFPNVVHAMTDTEITRSQRECEWSEYEQSVHCGGHGIFIKPDIIKINPYMRPQEILANYIHENLHYALPKLSHDEIRRKTDVVIILAKRRGVVLV